ATEALLNEKLIDHVEAKASLFRKLLVHPAIKEVRGMGLMLAIELENFEFNKKVIDRCIANGVITDWFLHCSNSMRIAPPLIITEDEIRKSCAVIIEVIDHYA
ncbi:MAG: aminotransferase class III-fold pyridoxal phosphate-dependent enzyme, partial [Bacteroidetes bacterium]|nr:aminotransferase class III-fold pyridoxal phosphate-dependent enzyme [Bacteroidota bacterium]